MPCLFRYRWLKLPRAALPQGEGLSAYWARLAARAAFRKGVASYCGHENPVTPGMWSGRVVGLKSILGVKKRDRALEILDQLAEFGYLSYELNPETRQSDHGLGAGTLRVRMRVRQCLYNPRLRLSLCTETDHREAALITL